MLQHSCNNCSQGCSYNIFFYCSLHKPFCYLQNITLRR